jgi:hypothetical protein
LEVACPGLFPLLCFHSAVHIEGKLH